MTSILVLDDHDLIIEGTLKVLRQKYPSANILPAKNLTEAQRYMKKSLPDLLIMDLSLPEKTSMSADIEVGLNFLKQLFQSQSQLNIVVLSSNIKVLTRLKHYIDSHEGGFCIADKGLPEQQMLKRVEWAMDGVTYTRDIDMGLELQPRWYRVLDLAFNQGLKDKVIAEKLNVSERTVHIYWKKIQNLLEVFPDEQQNLRILTLQKAREKGLID